MVDGVKSNEMVGGVNTETRLNKAIMTQTIVISSGYILRVASYRLLRRIDGVTRGLWRLFDVDRPHVLFRGSDRSHEGVAA